MPSNDKIPRARAMAVGVQADPVLSPVVQYAERDTWLRFPIDDASEGRITFESLDALRMCRGEYHPYEVAAGPDFSWVSTVENSPWLLERYQYESKHYRHAYEFGGDVDEMLRDFSHYLFEFHDEFVEAIAAGIWIETTAGTFEDVNIPEDHPLLPLPESTISSHLCAHELVCQVRKNPLGNEKLLANARLCSQPLLEFALELEGRASVNWRLSLRYRGGRAISILKSTHGPVAAEFDGVANLDDVRPYIERWMEEVRHRRREMGK